MSQGIVHLCPSHSRTSSTLELAEFRPAQFPKPSERRKSAWQSHRYCPGNLAFRTLRYFLTAFLSSNNYFWKLAGLARARPCSAALPVFRRPARKESYFRTARHSLRIGVTIELPILHSQS